MNRKDFLKNMALLGVASPFLATLFSSCNNKINFYEDINVNFNGKVLIIGAGSAGLIAGHILNRYGIDFTILEASSVFGGRVKKIEGFADFPIDLGAEWIHTDPSIMAKLLNDPNVDAEVEIINYSPETIHLWNNGKMKKRNFFSHFYGEYKFKNSTWFDFFDKYIVPNISDKIIYNTPINEVDYSSEKILARTTNGETYEADKILLTVPINILKNGSIKFSPELPAQKTDALDSIDMPDGMKVFFEFSERFYPDMVVDGNLVEFLSSDDGDKLFYDAAFRKDSDRNILALFTVGEKASAYTDLPTDDDVVNQLLAELDEMFDGKASASYIKHVVQNWSKEPYVQGSYSHFDGNESDIIRTMTEPLHDKVYFAGEAFNLDGTSTVHGAGESSYRVVEMMLQE